MRLSPCDSRRGVSTASLITMVDSCPHVHLRHVHQLPIRLLHPDWRRRRHGQGAEAREHQDATRAWRSWQAEAPQIEKLEETEERLQTVGDPFPLPKPRPGFCLWFWCRLTFAHVLPNSMESTGWRPLDGRFRAFQSCRPRFVGGKSFGRLRSGVTDCRFVAAVLD